MTGRKDRTVTPRADGRDKRGRFAKGNRVGRGNAVAQRMHALREQVAGAITPQLMRAALGTMAKILADDDATGTDRIAAARVLLERGLGKVSEGNALIPPIDLGPMTTARDCQEANRRLSEALARGELTSAQVHALFNAVEHARKAVETVELEERLAALERAAYR